MIISNSYESLFLELSFSISFGKMILHILQQSILFLVAISFSPIPVSSTPIKPSPTGITPLAPRYLENPVLASAGLVLRGSRQLGIIAPNPKVIGLLTDFYLSVTSQAMMQAQLRSPENPNLMFTHGAFQLIFVADSWLHTVPWNVVVDFCLQMVQWTSRGYTGTYDRGYWNMEGTLGVFVTMRYGEGIVLQQ